MACSFANVGDELTSPFFRGKTVEPSENSSSSETDNIWKPHEVMLHEVFDAPHGPNGIRLLPQHPDMPGLPIPARSGRQPPWRAPEEPHAPQPHAQPQQGQVAAAAAAQGRRRWDGETGGLAPSRRRRRVTVWVRRRKALDMHFYRASMGLLEEQKSYTKFNLQ